MNTIQIVNQLQSLHHKLNNLEKRKRLRNILRIIGIGFLLYRDVDQEISNIQNEISALSEKANPTTQEHLQYIKNEMEKINSSQKYLQKPEEEMITFNPHLPPPFFFDYSMNIVVSTDFQLTFNFLYSIYVIIVKLQS